ncbi:gamma-glutamylcyclotransferase-like [Bombyx mandarina]|uniref:gamma-glutamylcyclotransferase n=1 Tax=Bombyx mandarina TaxID=7092 RepID=A0A6J2K4L3_BOMMA|nr:gamma-glutamylcyclotransferase-like [Bombyx mandarina]
MKMYEPDTFLYYSYGANLLTSRIHMHNPTAEFLSIARLDNYRLDFITYSKFWGGPTGTLVPTANAHVWGAIWRLHINDMTSLDAQKLVEVKKYYIKYVKVLTPYMGTFLCRAYIQTVNPLPRSDNDVIPIENWPSRTYKKVIILGALEHGLPNYYIEYLKKLKHNGEEAYWRAACLLKRYSENEPCQCRVPGRIPRRPLKLDMNMLRNKKVEKINILKNNIYLQ